MVSAQAHPGFDEAPLAVKLSWPRVPATLVVRERLIRHLDRARTHRLTLLSAATGSGKTTLLSSWASHQPHPVAWLSLDEVDNDPVRFWAAVIAALQTVEPAIGRVARSMLEASEQASLRAVLTALLHDLAARNKRAPLLLVLDDYQTLSDVAIHTSLQFVLEHLPAHVHFLLASRSDPDLPLARWRVRGELLEVRADQLRFSAAEATSFFTQALGEPLADADVQRLQERTEGWAAGLQLAALSLRQRQDRTAFVAHFAGNHRILEETFSRTGVSIMGKRMFDGGERFWPEEAPFHTPVFVMTHQAALFGVLLKLDRLGLALLAVESAEPADDTAGAATDG